ncbi:MAG: CapA family protein [Candidatus Saccharibacteria bacterium]|nr:CapA family protein [Candidatus Saccharibacteria bacterium]
MLLFIKDNSKILLPSLYLLLGGLMTLIAFLIHDIFLADEVSQETTHQVVVNQVGAEVLQPSKITGRYLMTGTVVWDRNVERASRQTDGSLDYEYPFRGLDTYQPHNYDAWVADLECPIHSDDLAYELGHTLLEFNCLPEFLPYAQKYFQFFNLANNHSDNSGSAKLEATRRLLKAVNIQPFGDPDPGQNQHACQVVSLPIKLWQTEDQFEEAKMPVAFCAWHYFYRLPLAGEIEILKQYAELMPVFAFLHMGAEYSTTADGVQTAIAHQVIDAGADFVIANNPHWVQNAELYKEKLIVYSTGNFIFDQAFNEEVKRSANIIVEIEADWNQNLADWIDLASDCSGSPNKCLELAQSKKLQKLPIKMNFDVIAGYLTNHQQAVGNTSIQTAVKKRLDWDALFKQDENH